MKLHSHWAAESRARWSRWLRRAIRDAGMRESSFPPAFAAAQGSELQRTLIKRWLEAKTTVSPESAYVAGEVLAENQHPYAIGLASVVAAGYFSCFIATVRALGTTIEGFQLAQILVMHLPLVVEADLADAAGILHEYDDQGMLLVARQRIAALQRHGVRHLLRNAWSRRNFTQLRYEASWLKSNTWLADFALQVAHSPQAPIDFAWSESVHYLHIWMRVTAHSSRIKNFPYRYQEAGDEAFQMLMLEIAKNSHAQIPHPG